MKNKKPILVTLAVFIGVMLLIAATVLILRGRGGASFRSGNVPYPYQWTERNDGSVTLKLDGSAAKEGVWSVDGATDGVVNAAVGETRSGRASAVLSPVSEGRTELRFTLQSDGERLAEVSLAAETSEKNGKLAVTVINHGERAMQGAASGGDERHPYTARTDEYGFLVLHIADDEPAEEPAERWTAESADDLIAAVIELRAAEGGIDVILDTRVDGGTEITVSAEAANVTYVFSVTAENGALRLSDSKWTEYAPRPMMADEEMDALLSGIADTIKGLEP